MSVGPQYVFAAFIRRGGSAELLPVVMCNPPSVPLSSSGSMPFSQMTGAFSVPLLK